MNHRNLWTNGLSDAPYYAISSLAQLLCYVIMLVDNKVLVEDFEDFAALKVSHFGPVCLFRYFWRMQRMRRTVRLEARVRLKMEDLQMLQIGKPICVLRVRLVRRWEREFQCE